MTPMDGIFIQIASYRDPELPRTVEDCLAKARHPQRLSFGICWQYDSSTDRDLDPYLDDPRFRVDRVHYRRSEGDCWARARANRLYRGETYTLQTDTRTRFAQYWDERLIAMLQGIDHEKPLLTGYPQPCNEQDDNNTPRSSQSIHKAILRCLNTDLTTISSSAPLEDRTNPEPSQFLASSFIFTLGQFCREVPGDPHIYPGWEQVNLAIRAYSHGYNFYCPNEDLIWSLQSLSAQTHWSDHEESRQTRTEAAQRRLQMLLQGDHKKLGRYGLGPQRTCTQFELYADVDFSQVGHGPSDYKTVHFEAEVHLRTDEIPRRDDYELWVFYLLSVDGAELLRVELTDPDILGREKTTVEVDCFLTVPPAHYVLWPKSPSGWGRRLVYHLGEQQDMHGLEDNTVQVTLHLRCMPSVDMECAGDSQVLSELISVLQPDASQEAISRDEVMFLRFGDHDDHELYFLQSQIQRIEVRRHDIVERLTADSPQQSEPVTFLVRAHLESESAVEFSCEKGDPRVAELFMILYENGSPASDSDVVVGISTGSNKEHQARFRRAQLVGIETLPILDN